MRAVTLKQPPKSNLGARKIWMVTRPHPPARPNVHGTGDLQACTIWFSTARRRALAKAAGLRGSGRRRR